METKDGCTLNIQIRDLGFSYPGGRRIFDRLTFNISKGQILSVLGPNGAGKSTLLRCIARLHLPDKGDILLDGKNYRNMSQQEIARTIGFVPQSISTSFDYKVIDYVVTGFAPHMSMFQKPSENEYDLAWKAIHTMKLEHIADKSVLQLSSGERQQTAIARVIAQRPSFILLDEPTAYLDVGNQMKVLEMLKHLVQDGYGVVMTTHNPDHVLLLDSDVAVIDRRGRFTFGKGREVLNEDFLLGLYDTRLGVFDVDGLNRKVCIAHGI
jgi:iron complex transport system ATP-binding protein